MTCDAPDLSSSSRILEPGPEESMTVHYGFIMDGVLPLANMSSSEMGNRVFSVYLNPRFETFEGGVKQFFSSKNEILIINVSL